VVVAEGQQQEAAERQQPHAGRDEGRRQQGVLAVAQPGQAGGRLRLLAGGERGGLRLQVEVGRMDPQRVDLVGGRGVAAVDDIEHLPHQLEAGSVPGHDALRRGHVVGLAAVGQEPEGDVQRPACLGEGRPQLEARLGKVGVGDGVLLGDLVAGLDPGVALGAEVLQLPDRPVGACRGPDGGRGQAEQHGRQAGGGGREQPAGAPSRRLRLRGA
jgi:hypothetical protein